MSYSLEWELRFIKYDVAGDYVFSSGGIETLVAFVMNTIAKKDATIGARLELIAVIGSKTWPASTSKIMKEAVMRSKFKKSFKR